mmetsp:Transcript_18982/g.60641  ORF Transcript_18982/g.60641 Transcript_18982/m.60641 type:complete len:258 (+) Transcript_18982:1853-2626(+)
MTVLVLSVAVIVLSVSARRRLAKSRLDRPLGGRQPARESRAAAAIELPPPVPPVVALSPRSRHRAPLLVLKPVDPRVDPRVRKHDVRVQDLPRARVVRVRPDGIDALGGDGPRYGGVARVGGGVVLGEALVAGRDRNDGVLPPRPLKRGLPQLHAELHRLPPPLRDRGVDVVRDWLRRRDEAARRTLRRGVQLLVGGLESPAVDHVHPAVGRPVGEWARLGAHLREAEIPVPDAVVGGARHEPAVERWQPSKGDAHL